MGQLGDNLKRIKSDCGNSWYFRVWALFWLICFALAVSVLFIVSGKVMQATLGVDNLVITVNEPEKITYPRFTLKPRSGDEIDFATAMCTWNKQVFTLGNCPGGEQRKCKLFDASAFATKAGLVNGSHVIDCNVQVTTTSETNMALEFDVEAERHGVNALLPVQIFPTADSWVVLAKRLYISSSAITEESYERNLVVRSNLGQSGNVYKFWVSFGSLQVTSYETSKAFIYDGWLSASNIGGFIVFLWLLHTILMFLVGIFLTNNSKFLQQEPLDYNKQFE